MADRKPRKRGLEASQLNDLYYQPYWIPGRVGPPRSSEGPKRKAGRYMRALPEPAKLAIASSSSSSSSAPPSVTVVEPPYDDDAPAYSLPGPATYEEGGEAKVDEPLEVLDCNERSTACSFVAKTVGYHGPEIHRASFGNTFPFTNGGRVTFMNGLFALPTNAARNGRRVAWRSIHIAYSIAPTSLLCDGLRCDLWVIWDKQPNGAFPPTIAGLFETAPSNWECLFPLLHSAKDRFEVLVHRSFQSQPSGAGVSYSALSHFSGEIHKSLVGYVSTYKGDTDAFTDIASGAIYIVAVGEQDAALYMQGKLCTTLMWTE